MVKYCPICGDPLENGVCLNCCYDSELDGDLAITSPRQGVKKKVSSGSLIEDLLKIGSDDKGDEGEGE